MLNEFNHFIDKRIISEPQPSELPCGRQEKIGLMSISKAGLYIKKHYGVYGGIHIKSRGFLSRIMAYACLRNVFPKLEFYD